MHLHTRNNERIITRESFRCMNSHCDVITFHFQRELREMRPHNSPHRTTHFYTLAVRTEALTENARRWHLVSAQFA